MAQHGLAGFFGLSERSKGRAANPDGAPVLMDRTPRGHEAGSSVEAGTTNEKPLLLAFHIFMSSTGLTTRANCMAHPTALQIGGGESFCFLARRGLATLEK